MYIELPLVRWSLGLPGRESGFFPDAPSLLDSPRFLGGRGSSSLAAGAGLTRLRIWTPSLRSVLILIIGYWLAIWPATILNGQALVPWGGARLRAWFFIRNWLTIRTDALRHDDPGIPGLSANRRTWLWTRLFVWYRLAIGSDSILQGLALVPCADVRLRAWLFIRNRLTIRTDALRHDDPGIPRLSASRPTQLWSRLLV